MKQRKDKPGKSRPPRRQRGGSSYAQAGRADDVAPGSFEREPESAPPAQLYGLLPVLEALRAGTRPLERIIVAEGAHGHRLGELFELARAARVPAHRVPRAELDRAAAGATHQGVIARVGAARYWDADDLLAALAQQVGTDDPPLGVALDGVADPRNLGAIIRTAECAGAHGIFIPERRAAGLTETVAKTAAGALEYARVARAPNMAQLVEDCKARRIWTVGAAAEAKLEYSAWDWREPCVIFLGGEGTGLRRLVRERCDALVRIPLRGRIESLNVSVAAGILLYEAVRQRAAARTAAYLPAID